MIGSLIGWIVVGLVAGFLRACSIRGDPMWTVSTIVLGVLGSLVGGGIAYALRLGTSPYEPAGWILATIGALVLLAAGWFGTRSRGPRSDEPGGARGTEGAGRLDTGDAADLRANFHLSAFSLGHVLILTGNPR